MSQRRLTSVRLFDCTQVADPSCTGEAAAGGKGSGTLEFVDATSCGSETTAVGMQHFLYSRAAKIPIPVDRLDPSISQKLLERRDISSHWHIVGARYREGH